MTRRPVSITEANRLIRLWHRHNGPVVSGLFAAAVERRGVVCGVAIVGRPVARGLQDGLTCEVTRLATDGTLHACSCLYGVCCRVAKELGWRKIVTYTLATEPGTSLRAAGFERAAELTARPAWDTPARTRAQTDLFGQERRPPGAKVRWERQLNPARAGGPAEG